jgi:RodZ C-terminal domain
MAPEKHVVTETKPQPFDERAALEQLEQLADKIQSTRRQRERAVAEFNAFVKTFKDEDQATRLSALQAVPRPEPRQALLTPPAPASPPPSPPAAAPVPPTIERRTVEPAAAQIAVPVSTPPVPPSAPVTRESEPGPSSWSMPRARSFGFSEVMRSTGGRLGLAVAGVVIVVLLVSWLWRGSGERGAADTPPTSPAATSVPSAPKPAEPTPVASTGPVDGARGTSARAVNVVLITSRPVWTRVTVDDRKVIEREIPGGQTIPLGADRAIIIRAGDAGAVKVIVDGKDLGVMGRDGQIASRTFSVPAAR